MRICEKEVVILKIYKIVVCLLVLLIGISVVGLYQLIIVKNIVLEEPEIIEVVESVESDIEEGTINIDNVVFVGNSLIEGLRLHSGSNAVFLSKGGINLDGLKSYIYQTLTLYDCEIVIIGMGSNEMVYFTKDMFMNSYRDLIEHIRSINPDSKIICMSVPPVTRSRSKEDLDYNNDKVKLFNSYIEELCLSDSSLILLDNTKFFGDFLNSEWSADGRHLYDKIYKEWYDFIVLELEKL